MANFEENSGDILKMVAMLERHLAKNGVFDSTSSPTLEQVEEALSESEGELFAWLAEAGFSILIADYPVAAKKYLAWYAALGTAYRLEISHPGQQANPRGNSRWQVLKTEYMSIKEQLKSPALDRLGVTRSYIAKPVITGVSLDDKALQQDDTDAVQPHFTREMLRNPARVGPTGQVVKET